MDAGVETRPVRTLRLVAAVLGIVVAVNVVASGMASDPASSLFLVPDVLVAALLLGAAALPTARAAPAILLANGVATGVFVTAVASYALRGELGLGVLACAVVSAGSAIVLVRRLGHERPAGA